MILVLLLVAVVVVAALLAYMRVWLYRARMYVYDKDIDPNCENSEDWYCCHRGFFARQIGTQADLVIYTLCEPQISPGQRHLSSKERAEKLQQGFKGGIDFILEKYPVLRGQLYRTRNKKTGTVEIWVRKGVFPKTMDHFLTFIDQSGEDSTIPSAKGISTAARIRFMMDYVVPILPKFTLAYKRIAKKLPIFGVRVVLLKDGYFAWQLTISHAVADGVTSYQIMDHLIAAVSGRVPATALNWDNPIPSTVEVLPDSFTERDKKLLYGSFPMMCGAIYRAFITLLYRRPVNLYIVDRSKAGLEKVVQANESVKYLTTNDILTAATFQACAEKDTLGMVATNCRGITPGFNHGDAGNCLKGKFLPAFPCQDPNQLHRTLALANCYEGIGLPSKPFYSFDIIWVSNWSSAQGKSAAAPDGYQCAVIMPNLEMIKGFRPRQWFIYLQLNEQYLAVWTNSYYSLLTLPRAKMFRNIVVEHLKI